MTVDERRYIAAMLEMASRQGASLYESLALYAILTGIRWKTGALKP